MAGIQGMMFGDSLQGIGLKISFSDRSIPGFNHGVCTVDVSLWPSADHGEAAKPQSQEKDKILLHVGETTRVKVAIQQVLHSDAFFKVQEYHQLNESKGICSALM